MRQLMHSFIGTQVPDEILNYIETGNIGAICLFSHNVESPQQLREMTRTMHDAARRGKQPPPIIGIDQEGGQLIAIMGGTTELPGNMALGATRSATLAQQAGDVLGRELLAMGVNMNFAPSVDVNNNPDNPVIGIRAFGDDPQHVGDLGLAMIEGMQAQGVIACAKHFPGHGDTKIDSHHGTPRIDHPLQRLHAVELKPFRAAIAGKVQAIMSAHIIYSAYDETTPSTLSHKIMHGLLREDLGFTGITITDAMDMHAVSSLGHQFAVEQAILAGNDLILLGHLPDQLEMITTLAHLENQAAVQRIQAARSQLARDLPAFDVVGCDAHQAVAQKIADQSITCVRGEEVLGLQLDSSQKIAVITVIPANLTPADTSSYVDIQLAHAIQKRHPHVLDVRMPHTPSDADIAHVLAQVADADTVVIGTISADTSTAQAEVVNQLIERGQAPIAIAMRTPYDLIAYPNVTTYLCSYGIRDVSMEAVARVLFGEIDANGQLPCTLPNIV